MVCRKERLALMWTEQRNTYDLEGSQSGFAATFSESNRSHHGRNQHNKPYNTPTCVETWLDFLLRKLCLMGGALR